MRRMPTFVVALSVAALAACGEVMPPTEPLGPSLAQAGGAQEQVIVVFHENTVNPRGLAQQLAAAAGGELSYTYEYAIKGFAGSFPAAALDGIRRNPNVAYIEPDAEVQLFETQSNPPWGLDRIDQRSLPLNGSYIYPNTGTGATVYILDTGVRKSHTDFGGRVQYASNGSNGDFVGDGHGSAEDCHGHGTHVAGSAAGVTYGVAKGAQIRAARVVNCNGGGQVSMAIAAVDWVTTSGVRPAVVNMSLGYGDVQSLRTAVENSIAAGVNYAVAAGNGNFAGIPQDACKESPAGAPNAVTVGATTSSDNEAAFSNYGPCVDILAPGVSVLSAWHTSNTATNTISGTSMATPHVAGAIALYLTANPAASPATVAQALTSNASLNMISLHRRSRDNGTPNRLLYTAFIGGGTEPPPPGNTPPTASFSFNCIDLACSFNGTASSDSDGSIVSYAWNFGDGSTGSGATISHTYASSGTRTVTLTVTDDDGATGSQSQSVAVTASPPSGFTLSVGMTKVRGDNFANLSWSGASGSVDIYRNSAMIDGQVEGASYTDNLGKGGGSHTYQVCNAGTTTCSNTVTVTY